MDEVDRQFLEASNAAAQLYQEDKYEECVEALNNLEVTCRSCYPEIPPDQMPYTAWGYSRRLAAGIRLLRKG
jgi:hypothetical protein